MFSIPWPFGKQRRVGKLPLLAAPYGRAQLIGNVYTNDPHVASEALRAAGAMVVRPALAVPDRKRLEQCVKRWRALAECYRSDVRDTISGCADDLEHILAE